MFLLVIGQCDLQLCLQQVGMKVLGGEQVL
jgi:hypothetical protein